MNHCYNHDVATGAYDCPYADVVNNTICCNCKECNYNSITKKPVVNNENTNYDLSLNDEDIIDYPF